MICSRRSFVIRAISAGTLLSGGVGPTAAQESDIDQTGAARAPARVSIVDTALPQPGPAIRSGDFSMVGQYHVDWLLEAPMQRLLDNMAASPSAFASVRFFHTLDSGTRAIPSTTIRSTADECGPARMQRQIFQKPLPR